LSLIEHIDGKDKRHWHCPKKPLKSKNSDESLKNRLRDVMFKRWFEKKYALAEAKIDELNADYANENWLLAFLPL
jgi:hypothetical protein